MSIVDRYFQWADGVSVSAADSDTVKMICATIGACTGLACVAAGFAIGGIGGAIVGGIVGFIAFGIIAGLGPGMIGCFLFVVVPIYAICGAILLAFLFAGAIKELWGVGRY